MNQNNTLFISDLHLGHRSICKYRTQFSSVEEHDSYIKDALLTVANKRQKIWLLGDIAFTSEAGDWVVELSKKCNLEIVLGNHDSREGHMNTAKYIKAGIKLHGLTTYKDAWLSHYPIHMDELRKKSINIHGHCVDLETEILTSRGWKLSHEVSVGDSIYSISEDGKMIEDEILEKHDYIYTGSCYELSKRSANMFFTEDHRFVRTNGSRLKICKASDVENFSQMRIVSAGKAPLKLDGICLSDNNLRLYIALAADGNITESGLGRFRFKKERKIEFISNLLSSMGVEFTKNWSRGMATLNFRVPDKILNMNIKGLDWDIVNANSRQVEIILETYRHTDGNRNNIYTSKKQEVDILSIALMKNGYSVKVHERIHGFSKELSYTMSIMKKNTRVIGKWRDDYKKIAVTEKEVWCVTTNTGMWFARRRGYAFLTGNCHSNNIQLNGEDDPRYFNASCENIDYKPIRYDEIMQRVGL